MDPDSQREGEAVMSKPIGKSVHERIDRLLELPAVLDQHGKRKVALRAEKRTLERKIKAREALVRSELLELDVYRSCSNADERAAVYQAALHADPTWESLQERLESLTAGIEVAMHEEGIADHERKALKAALEREYTEIIERVLSDRMLAEAVAKNTRVAA